MHLKTFRYFSGTCFSLMTALAKHPLTLSLVWQARRSASCLSKSVNRFSKALSVWETAASKCELEHLCGGNRVEDLS